MTQQKTSFTITSPFRTARGESHASCSLRRSSRNAITVKVDGGHGYRNLIDDLVLGQGLGDNLREGYLENVIISGRPGTNNQLSVLGSQVQAFMYVQNLL
ncbi:hypothetical protein PAAG_05526 [Paracoccidioides lutzii Pb01]|uniref:Uncharacterized protein n=1 Tax=Paracoccidioides lutzii (strain ATCC MYA-826 / Pb01) TaxID=502779 RepID=C1H433_PARBA|nr:hypothetical protein PAAG_05526 [Paracoccidioides lutzii Pb01]EEH34477.2 hypothetical protein PAAG_05526 [Paracoccidioides lutzii Pb01]